MLLTKGHTTSSSCCQCTFTGYSSSLISIDESIGVIVLHNNRRRRNWDSGFSRRCRMVSSFSISSSSQESVGCVHHIAILDLSPCSHFPQNLCAISNFRQREVHPAQTSQIAHYPCLKICLVILFVSIWLSCRQHRGLSVLFHLCQRNNYYPLTITPAFIRRLDIINRGFRYLRPSPPLVLS